MYSSLYSNSLFQFIDDHNNAINLIKREKDPQHASKIFNMVYEHKGFNHNNATHKGFKNISVFSYANSY
jgi:hypothetical protein